MGATPPRNALRAIREPVIHYSNANWQKGPVLVKVDGNKRYRPFRPPTDELVGQLPKKPRGY